MSNFYGGDTALAERAKRSGAPGSGAGEAKQGQAPPPIYINLDNGRPVPSGSPRLDCDWSGALARGRSIAFDI